MVLFDQVCRESGIEHLLVAAYLPTATGKAHRLHKTILAPAAA